MTDSAHPDLDRFLDPDVGASVPPADQAHLAGCSSCRETLEALRGIVTLMRRDRSPEPPASAVRRARELGRATPPLAKRLIEIVASLVPVTRTEAAVGVRGAGGAAATLRFRAEPLEVTVELGASGPHGRRLHAQVLVSEAVPLPLLARAERGGRTLAEVPIPSHGLFRVDGLPDPPFDLVLELEETRLRLPIPSA